MKASILIVDDDPRLSETLSDLLEADGYQVYQASTGREAVRAVTRQPADVILMDFNLTDKTGIEVIQDIRRIGTDSQILMMTGHASLDTALKAIQESVYDFLIKPVDPDYLKRVLNKALEKLRLERENRRLIGELRKKNEQLLHLNNMKSRFFSMASHDLSNALMTLQMSFEMFCSCLTPDEQQKKTIVCIISSISQISRLTADLVDWASIEQGKFRLEKNCFDISPMLEEVINGPRARAAQKEIAVTAENNAGPAVICADKRRLEQVLLNLMENAVRHTPRGGRITLSVDQSAPAGIRFSVADTGEGISPEDAPRLFESFYQGEGSTSPKGRLGLGLSISREIITSHGGRIWVESEGAGKGAIFRFIIPSADSSRL